MGRFVPCIVAAPAVVALCAGAALAADVVVYLPGARAAEKRAEKLPGDDRHNLTLLVGTVSWPPADCADVCVAFEPFEKSAGRRGTLMRLYARQAGLKRDREVDFLPQVSADEVRAHTDTILIIVHSILNEVSIPPAEIPLPKAGAPGPPPLKPEPERPRTVEKPDRAASEKRLPPPHGFVLPLAVTVGADWIGNSMMAPALGFDAAIRLPYRIALSIDYRYRFPAAFNAGDLRVSAGGQRYTVGVGVALPRIQSLDTFVMFAPAIEAVEFQTEREGRKYANLQLFGAESKVYYRPQPSYGMFVLAGAAWVKNQITVKNQEGVPLWDTSSVTVNVEAGMFFEFDLSAR